MITATLAATGNNHSAAPKLGMSRVTLLKIVKGWACGGQAYENSMSV